MLDAIEKLLILQDRDRAIRRVQDELARIGPERESHRARAAQSQARLEAARLRLRQLEADRKRLELDVESLKQQIERYSNQQLQTRKNEEYRALAHEIETCKAEIVRIEDKELELMEQAEQVQKEIVALTHESEEARRAAERLVAELNQREENLRRELAALQADREALAAAVEPSLRHRYERLLRSKGERVVVGVAHSVCGGCHMRLPAQVMVACQAQQEVVTCTNCGRILYYTPDMVLTAAD
ncbi:MAG: C4-type zinc ribbon domain-containing protein [Verrucomicrobiae bacterium]|nr:C4-type zinc ribbon domain-containing protein [Verrucomicrobiae bacterium]MDW8310906.1 C4-type zinc ribbon domain-containing protein [Verrucomicrobiales bacterium]